LLILFGRLNFKFKSGQVDLEAAQAKGALVVSGRKRLRRPPPVANQLVSCCFVQLINILTDEQNGDDEGGGGAVHVEQGGDHDVADDSAEARGDHRHGHPSRAQIGREHLGDEAVKGGVAAADGAAEDCRHHQVARRAVHEEQTDGAHPRRQSAENWCKSS